MIRRREFISLLGGAAAWPLPAHAQQAGDIVRIGVLNTGLDDAVSGGLGYRAFVAELQKLGFAEGRNLVIDYGRTDQCRQGFRRCGRDGSFKRGGHCRQRFRIAAAGRSRGELEHSGGCSSPTILIPSRPRLRGELGSAGRRCRGIVLSSAGAGAKARRGVPDTDAIGSSLGCKLVGNGSAAAEQTAKALNLQVHSGNSIARRTISKLRSKAWPAPFRRCFSWPPVVSFCTPWRADCRALRSSTASRPCTI